MRIYLRVLENDRGILYVLFCYHFFWQGFLIFGCSCCDWTFQRKNKLLPPPPPRNGYVLCRAICRVYPVDIPIQRTPLLAAWVYTAYVCQSCSWSTEQRTNILPVPVSAWEIDLVIYVRLYCLASARSFSTPKLNMVLTYEILLLISDFRFDFH